MKKLSNFALVLFLGSQTFAANLDYYRGTLPRLKSLKDSQPVKRISDLRKKLGTHSLSMPGLTTKGGPFSLQSENTSENRIYSSIYFKELFFQSMKEVASREKNDAPIPYNPAWTRDQQRDNIAFNKHRFCVRSLMIPKTSKGGKKISGISFILDEILMKLVIPEQKEKAAAQSKNLRQRPVTMSRVQALTSYIDQAPLSKSKRRISDIFGKIIDVEYIDGHVQRIIFKNHTYEIEVSLPMLITSRIGENESFLDIQEHLIRHLQNQRELFIKRISETTNGGNDKKIHTELLKWFYEGETSYQATNELEFIKNRILRIDLVLPYLEEKFRLAKRTTYLLAGLSLAQKNYMIDLFLQLRGTDILTQPESAVFGEDFAIAMGKGLIPNFAEADYQLYVNLDRLIARLELFLDEEVKLAEAKQQDLAIIRSGHR